MKLWFKFYFVAVLLTILAIALIGINFIENDFKHILENKADLFTNNAENMARTMESNISANEITYGNATVVLDTLVDSAKFYEGAINNIDMHYEVFYQNYSCYSNYNKAVRDYQAIERGSYLNRYQVQYKIKENDEGKYLVVNVPIRVEEGYFSLSNYYNLNDVYQAKINNYVVLIMSSAVVLIITLIVLFIYTKWITRPLSMLLEGTRALELGDYSYRVAVNSGDEFEIIGKEFNAMAKAVERVNVMHDKLNDKQQSFIANFTHELRTPLTSLMGFSQLLQSDHISAEDRQIALDHIVNEGERLVKLSKQMSTLMELENNEFDMESLMVDRLFDALASIFKHRLEDYNIIFDNKLLGPIWCNYDLLTMCMINIMDNALKASPKGSTIYVYASSNAKSWMLQVKDQGVGISKENLEHVKEAFFMGDRSREKAVGSMGLGLSLCDKIARIHQGRLTIDSMENIGTVVTITAPHGGDYNV